MNNSFPPNTEPNLFSLIAVVVGAILAGDYTANELNSMGNWIELVAQYLLTVSAQQTLIESRIDNSNININSKQYKNGGSPYSTGKSNQNQRSEVDFLLDAIVRIENELNELKKKMD